MKVNKKVVLITSLIYQPQTQQLQKNMQQQQQQQQQQLQQEPRQLQGVVSDPVLAAATALRPQVRTS